jgi:hypothetical protein
MQLLRLLVSRLWRQSCLSNRIHDRVRLHEHDTATTTGEAGQAEAEGPTGGFSSRLTRVGVDLRVATHPWTWVALAGAGVIGVGVGTLTPAPLGIASSTLLVALIAGLSATCTA